MKQYRSDYLQVLHSCLLLISFLPAILILLTILPYETLNALSKKVIIQFLLVLVVYLTGAFLFSRIRPDMMILDNSNITVKTKEYTQTIALSEITRVTFDPGYFLKHGSGLTSKRPACLTLFNNNQELIQVKNASIFMLIGLVRQTSVKFKIINLWRYIIPTISMTLVALALAFIIRYV